MPTHIISWYTRKKVTILVQYLQKNNFARLQCKSVTQACEWQLVGSPVTLLLLSKTLWKFLITAPEKANSLVSLKGAACLWSVKKKSSRKTHHISCLFRHIMFLVTADVRCVLVSHCFCGLTCIKTLTRPTKLLPQLQGPQGLVCLSLPALAKVWMQQAGHATKTSRHGPPVLTVRPERGDHNCPASQKHSRGGNARHDD